MEDELKGQEKELADDINSLNKKSKYLEKQFNDAQSQLRDIALFEFSRSVEAFKKALECLPSTGELSKSGQMLKEQFQKGLKKARDAKVSPSPIASLNPTVVRAGSSQMENLPWKRALAMEPTLLASTEA
ncbi:hypothetical protein DXG03_000687 [Asterophora parasitica]|uniref:Uncharacterized protein n=1 Tax=Asterophora parasitica TaxID=117018 RepID=A0A9P7KD66_9AGAR|nr:hypothetical protein DXG03_000687 [Asterophora parasitica]